MFQRESTMNPAADYPILPSHYSDETARLGFEPVYLQPPETKTFAKPKPKPIVYTPPAPAVNVRPAPVVHSPVVRKMNVVEPALVKKLKFRELKMIEYSFFK